MCGLNIFAGARWKLQTSNIYVSGWRIYSLKAEKHQNYSGKQIIDKLISKRNEKTGIYSNIFKLMVSRENLFES